MSGRVLCPGTGREAEARQGSVYPHCPVCGRDFSVAGARRSKANARRGNPWKTGVPRHYHR
jgi:hypothetical protein